MQYQLKHYLKKTTSPETRGSTGSMRGSYLAGDKSAKLLQDIALECSILVPLGLRDMFLSAADFIDLSVRSSLVAVGLSMVKEQFVCCELLLAQRDHDRSGIDQIGQQQDCQQQNKSHLKRDSLWRGKIGARECAKARFTFHSSRGWSVTTRGSGQQVAVEKA